MKKVSSQLVALLSWATLVIARIQCVHCMYRCLAYIVLLRTVSLEWANISVFHEELLLLYALLCGGKQTPQAGHPGVFGLAT